MTQLLSSKGVNISQRNFQQIIIRGDGKEQFNQLINSEISSLPPSNNLEVTINDKFMFAKNSFDQWSLLFQFVEDYKKIIKLVSELNSNDGRGIDENQKQSLAPFQSQLLLLLVYWLVLGCV